MSIAGESARVEAERATARAAAHLAEARAERARARRFEIAAQTEKRTAAAVSHLAGAGYHLLADRRWPGSRTAQVDLVVVGPSGVWIVDTKAWRDMTVDEGRVFRDQEDVTEAFDNLAALAETTRDALAAAGLAPGEVHAIVAWAGKRNVSSEAAGVTIVGDADLARHIARYGPRLSDTAVDTVVAATLELFRPVSAPPPVNITISEPVVSVPAELDIPELPSVREVQAAVLEGLLAETVEEWMTFLHPDQARVIRRSFAGPSRIRGGAGTGKTVVGLHRAAYLARRFPDRRILFTTYVKTLPVVLRSLLQRMAPDVVDRVDFIGTDSFASSVLAKRGVRQRIDPTLAAALFTSAWSGAPGRRLAAIEDNVEYWREEIQYVIKGRGFVTFDQYANCARPGRRRILGMNQRRVVWQFFVAYEAALRAAGIVDFADRILLAEHELRREPITEYGAVIVDEAQDLTLAMIRMLHTLVGDAPDAFTLIGDGQQSIYPGGYTLAEAGISVAGRGIVFDLNYRNTVEILERAESFVSADRYADIEDGLSAAKAGVPAARHGEPPIGRVFTSRAAHDAALLARVRSVLASPATQLGDLAILCTSNSHVARAIALLTSAGLPCVSLNDYDGTPSENVRIGTIQRSKGLEFKQVLLPWTRCELLRVGGAHGRHTPESLLERQERDRRVLYVGMTRARDGVWVGSVGS